MTAHPAAALIAELHAKVHACLGQFFTGAPIALVDFPNIRNVGDSAIWLGEMAYLSRYHKATPAYVASMHNFSEHDLNALVPEGPVFVQGGGTFGDLWLGHQEFRERLLQNVQGRPIVQLPQSIHYNSPARAEQTARVIAKHGNFTLVVRDQESQHFAEKHFDCRVLLCPDMALCIGALQAPPPKIPLLAMLRGDREQAAAHDLAAIPNVPVEDWITEPWLPVRLAKAMGMAHGLLTFNPMRARLGLFNAAAHQRFDRGIRQIGRARAIVTDRLHVHILSLLLGRPHAVLDNSYGKITRFMAAFEGNNTNLTYRATSLADAIEWARAQAR